MGTSIKASLFAPVLVVMNAAAALARQRSDAGDPAACAACGSCGAFGAMLAVIPLVVLVVNIALLVWVARDAKARGMDNAVLWMILVMFTSVLGLILYILSRPKGDLAPCPHCGNQRLSASAKCPHCGNS
jgi:uncharacterized membrane protein YhaH (DUF805 family)